MMTISLHIGLLLLLAFPAKAAESNDRYADLQPVSEHYIGKVVERAKKGLEYAKGQGSGGETPPGFLYHWSDQIASAVLGLIDTDLRLTEQQRDLIQNSPCLRIDVLILEGWMERARAAKMSALAEGNPGAIVSLIPLQRYLNDRYKALLLGAFDPNFKDESEGKLYAFDPTPYWCCPAGDDDGKRVCKEAANEEEKVACTFAQGGLSKRLHTCISQGCTSDNTGEESKALCPYTTDYFPPTVAGYGCDTSLLSRYTSKTPDEVKKEYEALKELVKDRDKYINDASSLKSAITELNGVLGIPTPDLENFQKGRSSQIRHRKLTGCVPEDKQWPQGLASFSLRGSFSIEQADQPLLVRLHDLWTSWGKARLAPEYLRYSYELEPGEDKDRQLERETGWFMLIYMPALESARDYLQKASITQLGEESLMVPKAIDMPIRLFDVFRPLREKVREFADSSKSDSDGFRAFAKNFAYFLRRSCIFRPCSVTLDRVLKIVFEQSCFPYSKSLNPSDPKAGETCKKNAKL